MAKKQHFKKKNVLILASGNGSNFEAIVKYFRDNGFRDKVNFELLCDKKDAPVLKRAETLCVPHHCLDFENFYDFILAQKDRFDLYVLAGFMRVLPEKILEICSNGALCGNSYSNIINVHPSLLPEFKGKNAINRAFEAGAKETGVTVHFVSKEVDCGQIIAQKALQIKGLSLPELEAEIHKIEHKIYPETIKNLLFKKNVLLFGGGAREHALACAISNSPFLNRLFLAKPNDGFGHLGKTIEFGDYSDLLRKAVENKIDILVVGPENPLCEGIADVFEAGGINVIGANKPWAKLEASKSFAKCFMQRNGIKTAEYRLVDFTDGKNPAACTDELDFAFKFFEKKGTPPVVKADGLALGKGVLVPKTFDEAKKAAKDFLCGKFGDASKKILLEEQLFGDEVSVISLWDGKTLVSFPSASDYKRLLEDNKGPNTGGMGSMAPSKISFNQKREIEKYLETLEVALKKENADFCGVIYSGLILTDDGVKVLEYNMRFGDPECQALLELLDTEHGADLLDIFIKMTEKKLSKGDLKIADKKACCVVLASDGYPFNPKKGAKIENLCAAEKHACKVYFAGVKASQKETFAGVKAAQKETFAGVKASQTNEYAGSNPLQCSLTVNGGRVLSIVKSAENFDNALNDIYKTAKTIDFDGKIYRKDIGML